MGKSLIQQARGKGGPRYRSPSFRFEGEVKYVQLKQDLAQGKIVDIVHCPGHSSPLMRVKYDKKEALLIAPEGIKLGAMVQYGPQATIETGNVLPLENIPEGTPIYNIENNPGDGGKFVRASGTFGRVTNKQKNKILVMLPSKKEKAFKPSCFATVGICAGGNRLDKPLIKAGNSFYKFRKKNKLWHSCRGLAQNAVDHPYGCRRSSRKGKPNVAPHNAPPGRMVGKIRPRRTGRKQGTRKREN